jgi:hypothetical protein
MKTRTFLVYSDPGHAWVKVPKPFLARILGSTWRQAFTSCSYERGVHAYLEEDEDAARLITHCRAAGIEPVFKEGSTCAKRYSRIRNYSRISDYAQIAPH